jgi:hypothetical protein
MSKTPTRDELAVYLCDPNGEISIHGSPRDRLEVGKLLERVGVFERKTKDILDRIYATWCSDATGNDLVDAMDPVMEEARRFLDECTANNRCTTVGKTPPVA